MARYNDTYFLRKSGEYPNAKNEGDILPIPYGDLRVGTGPIWKCVLIDTTINQYLVADCQINTSNVTLYDSDETDITSSATITNVSGITTATFASAQGDVFARGTGKIVSGSLLENPIDIIEDILSEAGYEDTDITSFALVRDQCETLGYVGAGILMQDRRLNEIVTDIMSSFIGYAYTDSENKLIIGLSTEITQYSIRAHLAERHYDGTERVDFELDNIINQAECYYGKLFTQIDKRFKEGVRTDFLGFDDGSVTADTESQNSFGIRKRDTPFELNWVYDSGVVQTVLERIVDTYKDRRGLLSVSEQGLRNLFADVGQYCIYSTRLLRDEEDLPLKNQIGLVLSRQINLADRKVGFQILDAGVFFGEDPPILDGAMILDGSHTLGGTRNRRNLV